MEEYLKRQTFRVENAAVVALLALYRETLPMRFAAPAITRAPTILTSERSAVMCYPYVARRYARRCAAGYRTP